MTSKTGMGTHHGAGNLRILSQRMQEVFSLNFPVACVSLREWFLERPVIAEETELKLSLEDTERIPPLQIYWLSLLRSSPSSLAFHRTAVVLLRRA
jgi:hypothetical protein